MSAPEITNLLNLILTKKRDLRLSWDRLAANLPISAASLRIAFDRKSVKNEHLKHICEELDISVSDVQNSVDLLSRNILEPENIIIQCPLVPFYLHQDYLKSNTDLAFLNGLPTISWEIQALKGLTFLIDYRTFEYRGDEMDNGTYESFLDFDLLLAEKITKINWNNDLLVDGRNFILLHRQRGIIFCRISHIDSDVVKCSFLNVSFEDIELEISQIIEFYIVLQLKRNARF